MNKFAIYYSPILEEMLLAGSNTDNGVCFFREDRVLFRIKNEAILHLIMCNYELIGYCDL